MNTVKGKKMMIEHKAQSLKPFSIGRVTSTDSTIIGYRQIGSGPGLLLVHGGMMASQNLMKLATILSDAFTVYVPDRRGRGLSGPHGDNYCLARECEDIQALVRQTGARNIFGLSSGAIVVLQAALALPSIHKVAVYEPPLSVNGSSPASWAPRFEIELTKGNLAAAMVTVMKGSGDSSFLTLLPRFIVVPFMTFAIEAEAREVEDNEVPLKALIPTMHFDPHLVFETAGRLDDFKALDAQVLLLGGSKSKKYLKTALDTLTTILPNNERVEFPGLGHLAAENGGQPEVVAQELRRFFI